MRRPLVVGNWKMNGDGGWLRAVDAIAAAAARSTADVALALPATLVHRAAGRHPALRIAGQDCHAASDGAFTGGISARMLREAGASLVIVGHSETREADATVADPHTRRKVAAAAEAGLGVILCIGETAAERDAGDPVDLLARRLCACLPEGFARELVIAYEPVWAIGRGRSPAPSDIRPIAARLRAQAAEAGVGRTSVLYGGSVTVGTAAAILSDADTDGLLVGSASLDARSFTEIVRIASHASPRH